VHAQVARSQPENCLAYGWDVHRLCRPALSKRLNMKTAVTARLLQGGVISYTGNGPRIILSGSVTLK
jgi:hypothetical protein